MATLNKEVWIALLIGMNDEFWMNDWFLAMGVDMSMHVEHNEFVNFAHKGVAPNVIKDAVYPLLTVTRTDIPDKIRMGRYSTERTKLPHVDLINLAYNKKDSVLMDHREALINQIATEGMWNVSPYEDTASTPVIETDAGNPAGSDTFKTITGTDIMNLRVKIDVAYPKFKNMKWVLVMDPIAFWSLINSDVNLKGQIQNLGKLGTVGVPPVTYYGFEIRCDGRAAHYSAANQRLAFGTVLNPGAGDRPAATAFIDQKSFATAVGDPKMFLDEDDSEFQADFASFFVPASVTPWSEDLQSNLKYLGAIIRK